MATDDDADPNGYGGDPMPPAGPTTPDGYECPNDCGFSELYHRVYGCPIARPSPGGEPTPDRLRAAAEAVVRSWQPEHYTLAAHAQAVVALRAALAAP